MATEGLDDSRLRTAFERAPIGIAFASPQGVPFYINPAVQKILGYSLAEFQRIPLSQFTHPEDVAANTAALQQLVEGKTNEVHLETRYVHKSGKVVWCRVEATAVRDATGALQYIVTMIQDITEHKGAEEKLRHSEQRFRTSFYASPIGIFLADAQGKAVDANGACREILGYSLEELRGVPISQLTHPDDVAASKAAVDRIRKGQTDHAWLEKRYLHKSGRPVWCRVDFAAVRDEEGHLSQVLAMLQDITKRKMAETELRASEERFRSLLEGTPGVAIQGYDPQGIVRYWNKASELISGFTAEEAIGKKLADLIIPPEHHATFRKALEAGAAATTSGEFMPPGEYLLLRKNGSRAPIQCHHTAVCLPSRPPQLFCIGIDLSERKQAEQALRESQRALATLMSNLPGMAYRCRNDRDWTMEFISEGCAALTGYRPDDLIGNRTVSYAEIIHPDDRDNIWVRVQEVLAHRKPFQLNYRILTRDGKVKWVWEQGRGVFDDDGNLLALEGLIVDVSDRKQAEEALTASERMLSSIIDQSPFSTWIADAEGTNIRQNAACRRLMGIDRDEQTVGVYNLFRDQEVVRQGHMETIRKVFTEGQTARFTIDYDFAKAGCVDVPHGRRHLLDVTIFPVKDESGKVIYAVVQHEDITQLRDKEEQLRQAQKMEAIGKLVGGIAHDFNNQLTVVKGYCDLLLRSLSSEDPMYEPIEQILKAAQRSSALTSQLLAYGRKQALHPQILNLNQMLRDMIQPVRKLLGDSIELTVHLAEELGRVRVDPVQVQQALMNIFVNARDAMPDGGQLTVSTANVDLPPTEGEAGGAPTGPFVMLQVSDTGIGMDDETRQHIFDPFFTTKPLGHGTGLGLSMVYGFVRQSGGKIEVSSKLGEGTTVGIYLPRAAEPVAQTSAGQ